MDLLKHKMTDRVRNEHLTCFNAYDILGKLDEGLNKNMAHRIGSSLVKLLQSIRIGIGYDMSETSHVLTTDFSSGVQLVASTVLDISALGTEEMCWAVAS